jgi:hypothetical protein
VPATDHTAVTVRRDVHHGVLRAADQAFRRMRFDRPAEAAALRELSVAWAAYLPAYERLMRGEHGPEDTDVVLRLQRCLRRLADDPVAEAVSAVDRIGPSDDTGNAYEHGDWPAAVPPETGIWGWRRPPHNLPWLNDVLLTNVEPVDLYVWTTVAPEDLPGYGLPTSDLFLLARLLPHRLAADRRSGFMLRLSVPAGAAVDLSSYSGELPVRLRHRLREAPDTYVLPVAWLDDVAASACYRLDGDGGHAVSITPGVAELTVSFRGGDHGVPGLPNDVVRWPPRRAHEEAYLTVPDDPDWIAARLRAHPGWLPINRRRPQVPPGYHLLRLDVALRRAIDIRPTVASMASSRIRVSELAVFTGVDLALPAREFARTTIPKVQSRVQHADADPSFVGRPLTAALPALAPAA